MPTKGKKVPVVFDGVGKDTWAASLDCLQPRGLLVSFGNASGAVPPQSVGILNAKGSLYLTRPSLGAYTATRADLEASAAVVIRIRDGDIRAVVDKYGPTDKETRDALAATLIARKADIEQRFPAAAKIATAPTGRLWDIR